MEKQMDDTTYNSLSTIDNPPRGEPKEGKQDELFESDEHEQEVEQLLSVAPPDRFAFKLTLVLKADDGTANSNPMTIPVAAGSCYSDRVEEVLKKQFNSARFTQILRAVVGEPNLNVQMDIEDTEAMEPDPNSLI